MRVLVLWAGSTSANLGVRVLAEGMAALATRAWGDRIEVDFQDYGPGDSATGFGGRTIIRDVGRAAGPIKRKLRDYDVVLDSGAGDSFADIYGIRRLATMNYAHRIASRLGVPIVLGPQTIGPFDTALGRALGRDSLKRMSLTVPRDSESFSYASRLGLRPEILSTDTVFALPQPPPTAKRDILVNVSGLLFNGSDHVNPARYRAEVLSLVRGLLASGRRVSLLAHVLANPTPDDDEPAVHAVARQLGGELEVVVPKDLEEARSVIASSRLVIGSRMHACLNALSTGVPAISWAYSRKFAPLMNDLGWAHGFDLRREEAPAAATLELLGTTTHAALLLDVVRVRVTAAALIDQAADAMRRLVPPVALAPRATPRRRAGAR